MALEVAFFPKRFGVQVIKVIYVKKKVSLQMVVASRVFGLTLLELQFSPLERIPYVDSSIQWESPADATVMENHSIPTYELCGESEVDVLKHARTTYREESKENAFTHNEAWEILKKHAKWDASDPIAPVDLTGHEKLFGDDPGPVPPANQSLQK
ncbi:hypothetical protein Tco_1437116 [Tanacetum coccineum]